MCNLEECASKKKKENNSKTTKKPKKNQIFRREITNYTKKELTKNFAKLKKDLLSTERYQHVIKTRLRTRLHLQDSTYR